MPSVKKIIIAVDDISLLTKLPSTAIIIFDKGRQRAGKEAGGSNRNPIPLSFFAPPT
jgi:hypothetical protein